MKSLILLSVALGVLVLILAARAVAEPETASDELAARAVAEPETASDEDAAAPVRLPVLVVTARKWQEDALQVPQSVTVIRESLIRDAGLKSIRDASVYVPNLNLVEFSSRRLSFPFVRGVGSGQGDPAVATYVDGVPRLSIGSTNLPLLNVERVEFLRGPQGTLYGRNALGGLIHVITRRPASTPEFDAGATFGSHRLRELSFRAGTPVVTDRLALSLAGLHRRRDGYTENDLTGNDVDDRDSFFGQAQLLWSPDEENEIRLSVHGERSRDGGFVLSDLQGLRARPHHIRQDFEGISERDIVSSSLTWKYTGEALEFTSISSFEKLDVLETSDFDFSALDGVRRRTEESLDSLTQELRLSSAADTPLELGGNAEARWLAGVLWFTSDSERSTATDFRPGGVGIVTPMAGVDRSRGRFDDHGIGVFGQATLTLFDSLDVGAGIRYDHEGKDADLRRAFESAGTTLSSSSRDLDEDYNEVLPRFDVAYRWNDEVTVYALAAKAFKAGGFNLDAPEGLIPFSPETSWTWEVGVKTSLLDGRLKVNAAYFHIDWDDMQLSRFDAAVGGYVTNAGESTSRGFELELAARPVEGLDLFTSFGSTDAEFDSYVDPFGSDVSGNDLPFAPETTWSAGAQWSGALGEDLEYYIRGEYVRVGSFHYDAGNLEQERYGLANFRVGVGGPHWRLETWVRNAFATDYVPVAFQASPVDPSVFVGESGAPRTWGITLSLDF